MVSVIIPCFNGEKYLAAAVESVLCRIGPEDEIIVVDDGSTDGTPEVAQNYGPQVVYVRQDNRGPAAARNRGLALARGEIIGFLDADDFWCPDGFEPLLERLTADDAPDIVKGLTQLIRKVSTSETGLDFAPAGEAWVYWNLGGTLYRREVFVRTGPFDEKLRFSEDIDWFLRARDGGIRLEILPRISQFHRRHGENMTESANRDEMNLIKVLKMSIDRRRGSPAAATNALSGFRMTSIVPGTEKKQK